MRTIHTYWISALVISFCLSSVLIFKLGICELPQDPELSLLARSRDWFHPCSLGAVTCLLGLVTSSFPGAGWDGCHACLLPVPRSAGPGVICLQQLPSLQELPRAGTWCAGVPLASPWPLSSLARPRGLALWVSVDGEGGTGGQGLMDTSLLALGAGVPSCSV